MNTQTIEQKIKLISDAIYDGVAIVLEDYFSESSNTRSNRNVVPLKIRGGSVLCFDLDKGGAWRQFRFERINGNVYEK